MPFLFCRHGKGHFDFQKEADKLVFRQSLALDGSVTTKLATYTPDKSAVKVGLILALSFKVAELPMGLASKVQMYFKMSPSRSKLAEPSKVT